MRNLPVHWHEGLFVRPHHFQAADRHWSEYIQTSEQWDHPFNYGLRVLEFSKEALANHQFEVHRLQARMRDGTLVSLDSGQEPDRLDLKQPIGELQKAMAELADAFEVQSVVRVYLGVPKLQMGRGNVQGEDAPVGGARYSETTVSVQDESDGGNDQDLQLRRLNVRLVLSTEDLAGYELLPIAQIRRASEGEATPQIDREYIPPVMTTEAWPGLSRDIVRAIYDVIGQKIEVLSEQLLNRGVGVETHDPGDSARIAMLSQLNQAYATLSVLAFTPGVHPLTVYTELCRCAGQLAIFSPQRRTQNIPGYDHEDLARIFKHIRVQIEQLINSVRDYEFQQRFFVGVGMGLQTTLEPRWFNSDWQWYIGVRLGDISPQECRELLSPGQLDWKFGSSGQVEMLFKNRMPGLELIPVDRAIRALPARPDWIYYEVSRRDGPAWRDVQATQTLALRLKDSLILNQDKLQGEKTLAVSARGRRVTLQFALYAVPNVT
jgi:type VI secretion system protein ImpJ